MFTVEVTLPSSKKRRIAELKNRDYVNIIKFCENNDLYGLSSLFDELYLDKDLDIYDRFYILIYVRMLFVGETLTYVTEDNKNIDIGLDTVLQKLDENFKDLDTEITIDDIKIQLGLPNCIYFKDVDDLLTAVIKSVTINNKSIGFNKLTSQEKSQVIGKLPARAFSYIYSFLNKISDELLNVTVVQQNDNFGIKEINVSIIGNGVMQFILNIYRVDIKSYYELIYMFFQKIFPGTTEFYNISPIESRIMLNIHNKRIVDENKELKKQQKQ